MSKDNRNHHALLPLGKQGPFGGNGHRSAHVQPGLTQAMDPAGGEEKEEEGSEQGGKREEAKEKERKRWRVTSGPS